MIRATDDVEKLRGFIGQGLLAALQALILHVGSLTLLFLTNLRLTPHHLAHFAHCNGLVRHVWGNRLPPVCRSAKATVESKHHFARKSCRHCRGQSIRQRKAGTNHL